jgi:hypothetical protein
MVYVQSLRLKGHGGCLGAVYHLPDRWVFPQRFSFEMKGIMGMAEIFNNLPLWLKTTTIMLFFGWFYLAPLAFIVMRYLTRPQPVTMVEPQISPEMNRMIRELVEAQFAHIVAMEYQKAKQGEKTIFSHYSDEERDQLRAMHQLAEDLEKTNKG